MIKQTVMLILLPAAMIMAAGADGGYAGAFLRMGFEGRSAALGDAFTAVPEGATAGFYNPAVLPQLPNRQAVIAFSFLPLDRSLDFVGVAVPVRPSAGGGNPMNAGVMLGWLHAGVDRIDGRDFAGNHTQDLSNAEHAFIMGVALSPSPRLSIGLAGKVLYNRIPDIAEQGGALTASGFGIDVGVFFRLLNNLTAGATLKDNMSKYTWNTDKVYERGTSTTYRFPRRLRIGAAWRTWQQRLLILGDIETSDKQNPRFHFGAEVAIHPMAALRLGWDHDNPAFGFGLTAQLLGKTAALNYAFLPNSNALSPDHVLSWTIDF